MNGPFDDFTKNFAEEVRRFKLKWTLRPANLKRRALLSASKYDHCLGVLLYRTRVGELNMECVGVVFNHPRAALNLAKLHDIRYHHQPITEGTKSNQEAKI